MSTLNKNDFNISTESIRYKEGNFPFVASNGINWILYDFSKLHGRFVPVKDTHIPCGIDNETIENVLNCLESWGFSEEGFEPCDGDLCFNKDYM